MKLARATDRGLGWRLRPSARCARTMPRSRCVARAARGAEGDDRSSSVMADRRRDDPVAGCLQRHPARGDALLQLQRLEEGPLEGHRDCYKPARGSATLKLLDDMKALGFRKSTRRAVLRQGRPHDPRRKDKIIAAAEKEVEGIMKLQPRASSPRASATTRSSTPGLTPARGHRGDDAGSHAAARRRQDRGTDGRPYVNPIFCMAHSGARGRSSRFASWPACAA
jgi:hypothetical protein